jgi:hypothetical protein
MMTAPTAVHVVLSTKGTTHGLVAPVRAVPASTPNIYYYHTSLDGQLFSPSLYRLTPNPVC